MYSVSVTSYYVREEKTELEYKIYQLSLGAENTLPLIL